MRALARRRDASLDGSVRIVESWGPFPIQPVIARAGLDPEIASRVRGALLGVGDRLAAHGLSGFSTVSDADYAMGPLSPGR